MQVILIVTKYKYLDVNNGCQNVCAGSLFASYFMGRTSLLVCVYNVHFINITLDSFIFCGLKKIGI